MEKDDGQSQNWPEWDAPFLATHFFPCLNLMFKNGSFLSVVVLVSVHFQIPIPAPPRVQDRIWHPLLLPPPPWRGLRQLNFPNVKNDAGQKQYSPCFLSTRRPATPSQEHGFCPPLGFQQPFLKLQRWGFRCLGCLRCLGVQGV